MCLYEDWVTPFWNKRNVYHLNLFSFITTFLPLPASHPFPFFSFPFTLSFTSLSTPSLSGCLYSLYKRLNCYFFTLGTLHTQYECVPSWTFAPLALSPRTDGKILLTVKIRLNPLRVCFFVQCGIFLYIYIIEQPTENLLQSVFAACKYFFFFLFTDWLKLH